MLAVVSPQATDAFAPPTAAAIYAMVCNWPASPSPRLFATQMTPQPLVARTPQRLQSPILLDTRLRSPICSSPHRRRTVRPRRRRHCARAECPIESTLHPFDRLPWISAMDTLPDELDLADIADLSQLVVDEPPPDCAAQSPGSGPIRRRKTSLRSNPLGPKNHTLHETTPQTPPSHINHSRITFHNLMPVFSCDHNARS
ncbi:hypothetical protein B0H19DRAFT_1075291 [Mycena capillaripes]|nr:hypothetical protein B0H19DRAFT_1075291 [Mycena capillaripes]